MYGKIGAARRDKNKRISVAYESYAANCSTRLSTAAGLGETTGIVYRLLREAVAQSCRPGMRLREKHSPEAGTGMIGLFNLPM